MKFLSSLDPKDRRLLLWSLGIAITLALFIGFVLPNENSNDNPLPSTYLAGQHGARAAYDSLLRPDTNRTLGAAPRRTRRNRRPAHRRHLRAAIHSRREDFKAVEPNH